MRDSIEIGSAPADEPCVQVTRGGDYLPAMRAECLRFIEFIRKHIGPEPEGARLRVKSNPHGFGQYLEVVCSFDDADEQARAYAYRCEGELPSRWDAPVAGPPVVSGGSGPRVCDLCREAAAEQLEDAGFGEGDMDLEEIGMLLGADTPDHLCGEIESSGDAECSCACHPQAKRELRRERRLRRAG